MQWIKRILIACGLIALLLLLFGGIAVWYIGFHDRGVNYDFDPEIIAASECRMWQHYYAGEGQELGMEMMALMREQFGLSLKSAYEIVMPMAKSAMGFARSRGKYDQFLDHMEEAYARLGEVCDQQWDARALAEAELAWWVARRTPGENSAEQVGQKITTLYTLLYGEENEALARAGYLRAQAAKLRDQGGAQADWAAVEDLLIDSYTTLKAGIALP